MNSYDPSTPIVKCDATDIDREDFKKAFENLCGLNDSIQSSLSPSLPAPTVSITSYHLEFGMTVSAEFIPEFLITGILIESKIIGFVPSIGK